VFYEKSGSLVKVENVIGWRLDLVRNSAEWKGSQVLVAKAEFFELIAKSELSNIPVSVYLYLDLYTFRKYYEVWLEESGLTLNELVTCLMIEIDCAGVTDKKEYLNTWYENCSKFINVQTQNVNSADDESPTWLAQHQQTQYDLIMPIYYSHSNHHKINKSESKK
jgi:hypothetical protein